MEAPLQPPESIVRDATDPPVRCTVIVPVFDHWHLVPELLAGLSGQALARDAFEVLLVDNGSARIPEDLDLPPNAAVLHCATPGSYAARNFGLRHARGWVVAFTDADCRPEPAWLEAALDWFDREGDGAVLAGGVRMFARDSVRPTGFELYDLALGMPQARYVARGYGVTANLFVPRTVFERVGVFDESRFSGGDAEFCRRAGAMGVPVRYLETAAVRHPARRSWDELAGKVRRVKGGQVAAGPPGRRLQWIVRTLAPPLRAWGRAFGARDLTIAQRCVVCGIQARLWGVEIGEMLRLVVLRGRPQR